VCGERPEWLGELVGKLSSLGAKVEESRIVLKVEVGPESLRKAAELLLQYGYDHLASVEGIDWPSRGVVEVVYFAESYEPEKRSMPYRVKNCSTARQP
jgi:NADH-quinone oxidoreductase subunit C